MNHISFSKRPCDSQSDRQSACQTVGLLRLWSAACSPAGGMEAQRCYSLLGLLCMLAGVLGTWTVSQDPSSISLVRVNSSAEITCSTTLSEPMGLFLYRSFHGNGKVVFLSLEKGQVTKKTPAGEFAGRVAVAPQRRPHTGKGCVVTLQLSLLGLQDTDLYTCSWRYFQTETASLGTMTSTGTVVIVRGDQNHTHTLSILEILDLTCHLPTERDPREQCRAQTLDFVLAGLSVTIPVLIFVFTGVLIVRCRHFKRDFRPARAVKPPRPHRPPHVPQHEVNAYIMTSEHSPDYMGTFRY